MRLNLPSYVCVGVVGAPIWLMISRISPNAGAFFAGFLFAIPGAIDFFREWPDDDDDDDNGGGGGDDPTPNPGGPGGVGRDVSDLTADDLIAEWATVPAEKEMQP